MFFEIFQQHNKNFPDIKKLISKKWRIMEKISKGRITAIPHAIALIKQLKGEGYKLAVASASTTAFIIYVLGSLEIRKYFDAITSADEVIHGKPAPDIFLLAAKKLGVEPQNATVIEDGRSDMVGAKKAGMKCIGLVKNSSDYYPADILVTSLKKVTPNLIKRSSLIKK
jgi:HAD superfamily hydrolase (TIGR01509 family)